MITAVLVISAILAVVLIVAFLLSTADMNYYGEP